MKNLIQLFVSFLLVSSSISAQTWLGSTNSSNLTYRDGHVLIGGTTLTGTFASTERVLQLKGVGTYLSLVSTATGGSLYLV